MTYDLQVNYNTLEIVATKFTEQADAVDYIRRKIQNQLDLLIPDGWEGDLARKFEEEMFDRVLPTLRRMVSALEEASYTTRRIIDVMDEAEDEAADLFLY